jgi:hypothetical protein
MSQRQCLPIDDVDSDSDSSEINFDLEQISAQKYLKSVRLERERTKEIVTVDIPNNYNTREYNIEVSWIMLLIRLTQNKSNCL